MSLRSCFLSFKVRHFGIIFKESDKLSEIVELSVFHYQDSRDFLHGKEQGRYSLETLSTSHGIKTVLVINDIVKADAGIYACHLTNPFGSDSQNVKVVVRGKPDTFTKNCILPQKFSENVTEMNPFSTLQSLLMSHGT